MVVDIRELKWKCIAMEFILDLSLTQKAYDFAWVISIC